MLKIKGKNLRKNHSLCANAQQASGATNSRNTQSQTLPGHQGYIFQPSFWPNLRRRRTPPWPPCHDPQALANQHSQLPPDDRHPCKHCHPGRHPCDPHARNPAQRPCSRLHQQHQPTMAVIPGFHGYHPPTRSSQGRYSHLHPPKHPAVLAKKHADQDGEWIDVPIPGLHIISAFRL